MIANLLFVSLHVGVALFCTARYGGSLVWVVGSAVLALAIIRSRSGGVRSVHVILLCLASGLAMLLSLALASSYYMQGTGFNDQFFYHLDTDSVAMAARGYGAYFYPALLAIAAATIMPVWLASAPSLARLPVVLPWILAVMLNYPLLSYAVYLAGGADNLVEDYVGAETMPADAESNIDALDFAQGHLQGKNIVLIYAESLEQLYFDRSLFPEDLLPRMRELAKQARNFTGLKQVRGTSWTIAGLVASQCGFPLQVSNHLASNSTMASIEKPYPDSICLADILKKYGYHTVYMGGAPLWFAGKGNFLNFHGYDRVLGDEELSLQLHDSAYRTGWGLYDDSLFPLALSELERLQAMDEPWMLTLLTVDTHHPNGHPSKSCDRIPADSMSNAIYCSDQLISGFIAEVKQRVDMENTVIVVFSDHLAMRNKLSATLKQHRKKRKLTLMAFDNQPPAQIDRAATHFDVAPTVLELADLPGPRRLGMGYSLLSEPKVSGPGTPESSTPVLISSPASALVEGVAISRSTLSLRVGDLELVANEHGKPFRGGMYLLVLGEDGRVVDAIFSGSYETLSKNLAGAMAVGFSIHPQQSEQVSYFYGRLTADGSAVVQQPLLRDVFITVPELQAAYASPK